MDWTNSRFRRFSKIIKGSLKLGVGASATVVLGVAIYQRLHSPNTVCASWTTNFEPSHKWDKNWDRRDPASTVEPPKGTSEKELLSYKNEITKNTPVASRHLLLIRHGQYFDTVKDDKERVLTELGRIQADLTGQRLKDCNLPYTNLTSSTMVRAHETAELIKHHLSDLEIIFDDVLREGAPIPPEPQVGNYRPEKKQFFQDGARIESAFRKYFYRANPSQTEDSFEIIVCHSNVIRYFICRALQFPVESWLRVMVANCSLTLITIYPDGKVVMEMMGDHGHLPPNSVSYS